VPSDGGVRAVIDTNVLLSGLLWRGPPHALIEHARAGMLTVVSSPALLAELAEVIARVKFQTILARSNTNPERMLAELQQLAEIVRPISSSPATPISSPSAPMPASPSSMRRTPSLESADRRLRRGEGNASL
jgi:putative PIN family toxin of toxin-antitoxin system